MRISISNLDPGYVEDASIFWRVELDGVQLMGCVTADEETGEVWLWCADGINKGEFTTYRDTGRVRIYRDEGEEMRYAVGSIGWIDRDRIWTWAEPSNPEYPQALKLATHFWDHEDHRWYRPGDKVLS